MKKIMMGALASCSLFLSGCGEEKKTNTFSFATSPEYPPFEYRENGELKGFDIDLAKLIAKELEKEVAFQEGQFSSLLAMLDNGKVDAAISTFTITEDRQKNFDFSTPYHFESMAAVFKADASLIKQPSDLTGKKVVSQLGSTMALWLQKHAAQLNIAEVSAVDNNNQCIEALKAGHADVVIMDGSQAPVFCKKNPGLTYASIVQAPDGFGIAVRKGDPILLKINEILKKLEEDGTLQQLREKWLKDGA